MERGYISLRVARVVIKFSLIAFLVLLLIGISNEYYDEANYFNGTPQILIYFYIAIYIMILGVGEMGLFFIKKKIKKKYPHRYVPFKPVTRRKVITIIGFTTIKLMIGFLVLLCMITLLGVYILTNHRVFYRHNSPLQMVYQAKDFEIDANILSLKTSDNVEVWASELEVESPKGIIIYLSGIEQPSVTQFYPQAKRMQEKGIASFLLEVRGHGKSGGDRICLGYEETLDVKAVLDYIKTKDIYQDVSIILQGVSMGGAVAINSFGEYQEIDALIAMSAYSSIEDEIVCLMKQHKVPDFLCKIERCFIKLGLKCIFGSNKVEHMNPITQIQKSNDRPVFLIGARGDSSVPIENLERLYEECPNAEVWIKESWEHFIINECDFVNFEQDKEYCEKIEEFIDKVIE